MSSYRRYHVRELSAAALMGIVTIVCTACEVGFSPPVAHGDNPDPDVTPVVGDLTTEIDYTVWKLIADFTWSDPDKDVRSGSLVVYIDGEVHEVYDFPHPSLTLLSDTGQLRLALDPFAVNRPVDLALELVDAEEHVSLPAVTTVDLGREFLREEEDNGSDADSQRFGLIELPAAITGHLDQLSYDYSGAYSGDLDYFRFRVDETTLVEFTLYWPTEYNDLGMQLYNDSSSLLASDDDEGLIPPEQMGTPLYADCTYLLLVAGRTGAAVDYVVLIDDAS